MVPIQNRHETLRHIGICQWYSKYTFPNTVEAPSNLYGIPEDSVISELRTGDENTSHEKINSRPLIDAVIDNITTAEVEEPSLPVDEKPVEIGDVSKPISVALAMTKIASKVILYERGSSGNEEHKLEEALLLSIIRTLDTSVGDIRDLSSNHTFQWPPFVSKSLLLDQSQYFKTTLRHWLGKQDLSGIDSVLYFGGHFNDIETSLLDYRTECGAEFLVLPFELTLSELLGVPIKKKSLWSFLSRVGVASV